MLFFPLDGSLILFFLLIISRCELEQPGWVSFFPLTNHSGWKLKCTPAANGHSIFFIKAKLNVQNERIKSILSKQVFFCNIAHLSLKTHKQMSLPHQGQSKQTQLNTNHIQLTRIAFSPIVNVIR